MLTVSFKLLQQTLHFWSIGFPQFFPLFSNVASLLGMFPYDSELNMLLPLHGLILLVCEIYSKEKKTKKKSLFIVFSLAAVLLFPRSLIVGLTVLPIHHCEIYSVVTMYVYE